MLTHTSSRDPHASVSSGPAAAGLNKKTPLPDPARRRQTGIVDAQSTTGRGSWCLGRKAAAHPVPARPLSRFHFFHSLGPQPRLSGALPWRNSPSGAPHLAGEGEGSRPRQAWGEIPRPLPLSPTPPSPLISQCCPRAWGEASAGAWEGGGGDPGREMGGWGDSRQPYPVQTPCPSDQPAHPLLISIYLEPRLTRPISDSPESFCHLTTCPEADGEARITGSILRGQSVRGRDWLWEPYSCVASAPCEGSWGQHKSRRGEGSAIRVEYSKEMDYNLGCRLVSGASGD